MKKINQIIGMATLVVASVINTTAQAGETMTEVKQGLSFGGGAIAGLAVGGPVGMIVGALGGAYVAEELEKADQLEGTEQALSVANRDVDMLEAELQRQQTQLAHLESELRSEVAANDATRLEFQLLFRTGEDQIQAQDYARIDMLASYLERNPEMVVRLDGHADPRGSEEYNNILAKFRTLSVANALIEKGIEKDRVQVSFHGSSASQAATGDYESYALERRVNIEVFNNNLNELAHNH